MKSKFWKESFKKLIPKNIYPNVKKCEKPFPNWNPNTKISYIELDVIVSKLVFDIEANLKVFLECVISD